VAKGSLLENNVPVFVVSFSTQEVLVFRNAKTAEVVVGAPDRVEQCSYAVVVTRVEDELDNELTGGWKIVEVWMLLRGSNVYVIDRSCYRWPDVLRVPASNAELDFVRTLFSYYHAHHSGFHNTHPSSLLVYIVGDFNLVHDGLSFFGIYTSILPARSLWFQLLVSVCRVDAMTQLDEMPCRIGNF
jgi:hypothetical protein